MAAWRGDEGCSAGLDPALIRRRKEGWPQPHGVTGDHFLVGAVGILPGPGLVKAGQG